MSRVIVTRHPNGEGALEAGFDRPLRYFFVDRYDADGEYVGGIGILGSRPCTGPGDARDYLVNAGVDPTVAQRAMVLLAAHEKLEYPESNVNVDLTA